LLRCCCEAEKDVFLKTKLQKNLTMPSCEAFTLRKSSFVLVRQNVSEIRNLASTLFLFLLEEEAKSALVQPCHLSSLAWQIFTLHEA
jgi:hypothetical protein